MPYIVTTNRYMDDPTAEFLPGAKPGVERRAVATLDEARGAVIRELGPRIDSAFEWDLGLEGGTIGPLPDGTVIKVKATTTTEIEISLGCTDAQMGQMSDAEAVKAFNDKERTK